MLSVNGDLDGLTFGNLLLISSQASSLSLCISDDLSLTPSINEVSQ